MFVVSKAYEAFYRVLQRGSLRCRRPRGRRATAKPGTDGAFPMNPGPTVGAVTTGSQEVGYYPNLYVLTTTVKISGEPGRQPNYLYHRTDSHRVVNLIDVYPDEEVDA